MSKKTSSDPFLKMKLALIRSVLSYDDPTIHSLEAAFIEEFGSPPTPKLINAFKNGLKKKQKKSGFRTFSLRINLIKEIARKKREEKRKRDFQETGGKYIQVALDLELQESLERLQAVYGTHNVEEVITLSLKMLEQQARRIAPEIFRI